VTAREAILAAIERAAAPAVPLPAVPVELAGASSLGAKGPGGPGGGAPDALAGAQARRAAPDQLEIPLAPAERADQLVRRFIQALEQAGGTAVEVEGQAALSVEVAPDGPRRGIVACVPGLPISTLTIGPDAPRERLDQIGVAIVPARFGVAENGAVWVDERDLPHRAVPFIPDQLVVVLPKLEIVADLHEAYRRLRSPLPGYGVLIAGPSKTADIEQALVIGAQGPKSLVVYLV